MRTRAKALFVTAAMVTTFAILPTFGAAAAPLADGPYDVVVAGQTYTFEVSSGQPIVTTANGGEFLFTYEEGQVLNELDLSIDGALYDVVIADDGTTTVTAAVEDGTAEEPTDGESAADEPTEGAEGEPTEDEALEGESTVESTKDDLLDGSDDLVEGDVEEDELEEDEADSAHGALVSTVAQCAPKGREAREAGLPNHGFFVRAAAHGEDVDFEVDGVTHTAALSSQEGADTFCALAEGLLATDEAPAEEGTEGAEADTSTEVEDAPQVETAETDEVEDSGPKAKDKAADRGKGRANAPGQQKKNG